VRRPRELTRQIDRAAIFPTEHLIRLVEAAREGRNVLEVKVYDGAETGEKLYNATAIIGRRIAPVHRRGRGRRARPEARGARTLAGDDQLFRGRPRQRRTPAYSIAFELYENGVSRQLVIHYGEFSLRGDLTSVEWQPETACARP
jgi:hypothetical protein